MLAVRVQLLSGRYRASSFEDRRRPEWPPHPARLFYAAVHAAHDTDDIDPQEVELLRWWEELGAPEVVFSFEAAGPSGASANGWTERAVVDNFVPGNYATSWTRDLQEQWQTLVDDVRGHRTGPTKSSAATERTLTVRRRKLIGDTARSTRATGTERAAQIASVMELLPELRKRQPRHFPVVTPDDDLIYFNWPDATPTADQREVIDRILGRIARIGHSATPVSCSLSDFAPPPTWAPSDSGSHELRTVGSGVLDVLTTEYARHQGITSRVLPALMTNYAAPSAPKTLLATAANAGTWLVLPLSQEQRFPIHRTLDITRAVRSALMHHSPQPVPAFISGHGPGAAQTAPLADTHLSVLALPHATSPHADGLIHGIALAFPTGATQAERDDVLIALQRWTKDQTPDGDDPHYPVTMPGGLLRKLGLAREAATSDANRRSPNTVASRGYWSRVSDEWASVTPLALDRFPKARRGDDEALATAIFELVSASCDHVGLPSPVDVRADRRSLWAVAPPVTTGSGQRMSSGRPNRSFPQYSTGSAARPRFTAHVRIRFGEQVRGPIVLGAGRYFGYGLMMPIERDGLTT